MEITKEQLISEFKNSCDPLLYYHAIRHQHTRNMWDLDTSLGKMKIASCVKCYITLFPYVNSGIKGKIEFEITKEEYKALKQLYFGKIKPNKRYLKRLNKAISKT